MLRIESKERPHWRTLAKEYGFGFHSMYDQPYWDETAYYQFTLEQIERGSGRSHRGNSPNVSRGS